MNKKVFILGINISLIVLIFSFFEVLSGFFIRKNYLEDLEKLNKRIEPEWNFSFHPSVGNAHLKKDFINSKNIKNATSFNELYLVKNYEKENNKDKLTLLVLGGSTSDPLGVHYSGINSTWPEIFASNLENKLKKNIKLINAGVGGATSSNELLRLLTISNIEKIDYAISLNGINEMDFIEEGLFDNKTYLYSQKMVLRGLRNDELHFKNKIFSSSFLNNLKFNIRDFIYNTNSYKFFYVIRKNKFSNPNSKVNNGVTTLDKNTKSELKNAAKYWLANVKYMNAISIANNSKYYVFLQPTFGLDLNLISLKKLLNNFYKSNNQEEHVAIKDSLSSIYLLKLNYIYSLMREECSKLEFCFDISNDFYLNNNNDLYYDFRHHNNFGNQIISDKILNIIKNEIIK